MVRKKPGHIKQKSAAALGAFLLAPIALPDIKISPLTLPLVKMEYCDGSAWYPIASESWVNATAPGTITSITAGTGLSGGTITASGTIALANVGITPGTYNWLNSLTINAQGQVTGANSGNQPITSIISNSGLTVNTNGGQSLINIFDTGVTPGTYTWPAGFSVNSMGQLTFVTASGSFPINRLSGYPSNASYFLRGDGLWATPTFSSIDINTGTTGQLNISRLSGYPTSSNAFLRGDGTWILPYINNLNINGTVSFSSYGLTTSGNVSATTGSLIGNNLAAYNSGSIVVGNPLSFTNVSGNPISVTTNSSTNFFLINNTNSGAIGTGLQVQNNSVAVAEFGFNNSTNETYVWGIGSAILKFGTGNTKRMDIASNSGKATFYDPSNQCYIRPASNFLDLRGLNVYNSSVSTIFESNALGETSSLVMNGDFMQFINPLDVLGFIFTDEDAGTMTSYVAYINGSGQFITSSRERKHSLRKKEPKDYLERLNRLNVYSYGLKYDLLKTDSPKKKARKKRKMNELQVGVIAEDVLELFDNATNVYKPLDASLKTSPSHTPSLAINSHVLLCYTILAVQELTQRLITLEQKSLP